MFKEGCDLLLAFSSSFIDRKEIVEIQSSQIRLGLGRFISSLYLSREQSTGVVEITPQPLLCQCDCSRGHWDYFLVMDPLLREEDNSSWDRHMWCLYSLTLACLTISLSLALTRTHASFEHGLDQHWQLVSPRKLSKYTNPVTVRVSNRFVPDLTHSRNQPTQTLYLHWLLTSLSLLLVLAGL
jgi:hypothetical protein